MVFSPLNRACILMSYLSPKRDLLISQYSLGVSCALESFSVIIISCIIIIFGICNALDSFILLY